MNLPFTNIRQVLSLHNKVSPEKIFLTVITDKGREELSYAEFSARCHQTANFLQEDLGIKPGDVVALFEDDYSSDAAVIIMACWLVGAILVPIIALVPSDNAAKHAVSRLAQSGAKVAFIPKKSIEDWHGSIQEEFSNDIQQLWDKLPIVQLDGNLTTHYPHFKTLVRSMPNSFFNDYPEPTLDSQAALLPIKDDDLLKPMTQGGLLSSAQRLADRQIITGNQRLFSDLKLYGRIFAINSEAEDAVNIFLAALLVGSSLTISATRRVFEPHIFWREVAASRLHIACLSEGRLSKLVRYANLAKLEGSPIYGEGVYQQDITQLRHIYCPDAESHDELIKRFTDMFPFPVVTNNE